MVRVAAVPRARRGARGRELTQRVNVSAGVLCLRIYLYARASAPAAHTARSCYRRADAGAYSYSKRIYRCSTAVAMRTQVLTNTGSIRLTTGSHRHADAGAYALHSLRITSMPPLYAYHTRPIASAFPHSVCAQVSQYPLGRSQIRLSHPQLSSECRCVPAFEARPRLCAH